MCILVIIGLFFLQAPIATGEQYPEPLFSVFAIVFKTGPSFPILPLKILQEEAVKAGIIIEIVPLF
ncbi:MAG: hypothetical protein ACTSYD_14065 [Candidatus Heimdallarchaeaceae archaeon]